MNKSMVYKAILAIQIFIVVVLSLFIINKNTFPMGLSVNPINSKTITRTPKDGLEHYYEPKANTTIDEDKKSYGGPATYHINNDTLNERYDYEIKKKQGIFRIMTLGDSFTFGENVNTSDNYSEQLEDILNKKCSKDKFEVINLGVPGYDIAFMHERYLSRGAKYKPDLVIMMFGDYQLFRLNEELEVRTSNKPYKSDSELFSVKLKMISDLGWDTILAWQHTQIKSLTETIKSKQLIFKLPLSCIGDTYNLNTHIVECLPFKKYFSYFDEMASKNKDIFLLNDFKWNNKYFYSDGHPNMIGHKAIAQDIFTYLSTHNLISCGN